MEFIKHEIRNCAWKVKNTMQFTIDDTINVPDSLMDMERLILVKGNVVVEDVEAMTDRFQVKGSLHYQILYCGDKESSVFDSLMGKVPFVEYIPEESRPFTRFVPSPNGSFIKIVRSESVVISNS